MKTLLRIAAVAALLALPLTVMAQEAEEGVTTGHVEVGSWAADDSGELEQAAEYEPVEDASPFLDLAISTHQDWGTLFVQGIARHSDDVATELQLDVHRMVRSHVTYDKLLHRLPHDPLTNLAAVTHGGKIVQHTDLDPGADYGLAWSVLEHRTELQLPSLPALTFAVETRNQKREGHKQAVTMSHCMSCHAVSQTHPINEHTNDGVLEAKVAFNGGFIRGRLESREHTQGYPYVTRVFDDALHPEQRTPIFDARLQYDSAAGALPVDLWPDIDKDRARLDFTVADLAGFVVNGGGVWSETENRYTGLKADYAGYMLNASRRWANGVGVRWRGRVYSIDNDEVFVDTAEPTHIAGPKNGLTYRQIWGNEPGFPELDYTRYSALDRDAAESKLDVTYRLGKRSTLTGSWDLEMVDRDYYEVAVGETETTTNVLGIAWRVRPAKGLKLHVRARHAEIDNPFMLVDGACTTLTSAQVGSAFHPDAAQYFEFQEARVADTTASPSSWDEVRLSANYLLGRTTMLTGVYRFWDGSNDDGDLTDWSRTSQTAMLTFSGAPAEHWQWYAGYTWGMAELDAPACIPIFDG